MDLQVVDKAPFAELERVCKEMESQHSALVIVEPEMLHEAMVRITKGLLKVSEYGIYVSLNKPHDVVISRLKREGVDIDKLYFIDCVTTLVHKTLTKRDERVIYAEGPHDLDISGSIPDAIKKFMKSISGDKFILIDALRTLFIYNEPRIVSNFIHNLMSYARPKNVKVMVLSHEGDKKLNLLVEKAFDKVYYLPSPEDVI